MLDSVSRRKFAGRFASLLSAFSIASIGPSAEARTDPSPGEAVRKLNEEGKPADGKQMITPIVAHQGLIYIAGQGAHDEGPTASWEIGAHTTTVLNKIKKLVEAGGSSMDTIVQLSVFLTKIEDYDGMNKVFKTYFPNGGPARTTLAVAALPGNSLVEINCIAALPKK
jgi:2-iminobutanoate/2-iminopropanoate deaminase